MSQKAKKKQKKNSHTLYAIVVLLLGIAIIAMSILLVFHVQSIEVKGNTYVTSKDIADSVRKDQSITNSLVIIAKQAFDQIQYPDAVAFAKIRMKSPWKLQVTVKEKEIIGYTLTDEEYAYFGKDGTVLHKSYMLLEDIPFIEGMDVKEAKLYEKLPVKEDRIFRNIYDATNSFQEQGIKPDKLIASKADLTVYIKKVCVELGSGDMELKIRQIPPILEKIGKKKGTLDLKHYHEASEYISFKEGEFPGKKKK